MVYHSCGTMKFSYYSDSEGLHENARATLSPSGSGIHEPDAF